MPASLLLLLPLLPLLLLPLLLPPLLPPMNWTWEIIASSVIRTWGFSSSSSDSFGGESAGDFCRTRKIRNKISKSTISLLPDFYHSFFLPTQRIFYSNQSSNHVAHLFRICTCRSVFEGTPFPAAGNGGTHRNISHFFVYPLINSIHPRTPRSLVLGFAGSFLRSNPAKNGQGSWRVCRSASGSCSSNT